MLVAVKCDRKYQNPKGDIVSICSPDYGEPIYLKDKFQRITLEEGSKYLVDVQAKQFESKAFLAFNVVAKLG